MKNVLVLAYDDIGEEARLACAIDLVRALRGHLTCVELTVPPALVSVAGAFDTGVLAAVESDRVNRDRARVHARLVREKVPFTWRESAGSANDTLVAASWMMDLVVASCAGDDREASPTDVSARLFRDVSEPVFAVPHHALGIDLAAGALVAWDGSPCCEAAVRGAMPLLQLGGRATFACVDAEGAEASAHAAASYCERHGIVTHVAALNARDFTIAQCLIEDARFRGASWFVAGAYGHAAVREALFGGVTRELLLGSPLPISLVHVAR